MTEQEVELCKQWLKSHAASWQVLNRAQWKYQFHPKTLVRFIDEASMRENEVRLILEYLTSDKCLDTLSLYDQAVEGYKVNKAWYEISNKAVSGVRGVRLYHALVQNDEQDDGPYVIEDGCAWKVTHTFVWESATEPNVEKSTSGVMYRILNLRRDEESGLFSYVKETRERVQQDVDEYIREVNLFSEVKESAHYGVKADAVVSTGKNASVANGVVVERKVTKNEDCTSDVVNVTTTEQEVENALVVKEKRLRAVISSVTHKNQSTALTDNKTGLKVGETRRSQKTPGGLYDNVHETIAEEEVGEVGTDCEKTIFTHEDTTIVNQNNKPAAEATSASGGKIHRKSARQTEYGTWDVTESTTTEQEVKNALVVKEKRLKAVITSVTDKNQATALTDNTTALKVGETRRSQKTPGGLYDNTHELLDKEEVGEVGTDCEKTIFTHEDTTITNQNDKPEKEAQEAAGGVVVKRSSRQTEYGTWDVTESTTTEKAVAKAVVVKTKRLHGTTISTTNRNQTTAIADSESVLALGETRRSQMTPGGLYDNTTETVDTSDEVGKIGEDESKTVFATEKRETSNIINEPKDTVKDAANGVIESRTKRKTEYGTWDVTESTTTEKAVAKAVVVKTKRLHGTTISTTDRNQKTAIANSESTLALGETRRSQMTPGGLYDNTTETVDTSDEVGKIGEDESKTVFATEKRETSNIINEPKDTVKDAANGVIESRTKRKTEYGTWDVIKSTTTEQEAKDANKTFRKTLHGVIQTTEDKNSDKIADGQNLKIGEVESSEMTPGKRYNYTKTTVTPESIGQTRELQTEDAFSNQLDKRSNYVVPENSNIASEIKSHSKLETFKEGEIHQKVAGANEYGTIDVDERTITAKEQTDTYEWSDDVGSYKQIWYRNYTAESFAALKANPIFLPDPDSKGKTFAVDWSDSINEFGLHNGTIIKRVADRKFYFESTGSSGTHSISDTIYWERKRGIPKRTIKFRKITINTTIKRGMPVSSYYEQALKVDPESRENNALIGIKRLGGTYKNGDNQVTDWVEVTFKNSNPWEDYDPNTHKDLPSTIFSLSDMVKRKLSYIN